MEESETMLPPVNAPRRRGIAGILVAVVVALLLGMGVAGLAFRHVDRIAALVRPEPPAPAPIVRVVAPPVRPAPTASNGDVAMAERLGRIEAQIAEIDSRAAEASGDANRAEGLLVAFAARRALDRGQPMGFLEPLLRRHFGAAEPQSVAMIIGAGQRPVTLVQLQQQFALVGPTLAGPGRNESFWTALRREFGSLFVIRKVDEPASQPADRLVRAERALDLGQVDVALDEVARLPGSQRAGDWIAAARRYAMARNALDRIETAALLAPAEDAPRVAPAE